METRLNKIRCPAKPITYAFKNFNDSDERNNLRQIGKHFKERVEREENKHITVNEAKEKKTRTAAAEKKLKSTAAKKTGDAKQHAVAKVCEAAKQ